MRILECSCLLYTSIKVRGETEWDRYDNCLVVMLRDINKGKIKRRQDTWQNGKRAVPSRPRSSPD